MASEPKDFTPPYGYLIRLFRPFPDFDPRRNGLRQFHACAREMGSHNRVATAQSLRPPPRADFRSPATDTEIVRLSRPGVDRRREQSRSPHAGRESD
jgi:hypothetical protein